MGKSSFLMRLCTNVFSQRYASTIGEKLARYNNNVVVSLCLLGRRYIESTGERGCQSVCVYVCVRACVCMCVCVCVCVCV